MECNVDRFVSFISALFSNKIVMLADEPSTGEMHANITLMPDHDQGEMFVEARRHTSLSKNLLCASVTLSHHQLGVPLLPLTHLQHSAVFQSYINPDVVYL
ncbi:hypothetical protein Hdeb2414_s0003g00102381 [Helianthus debilis subsp. tardiflorus]